MLETTITHSLANLWSRIWLRHPWILWNPNIQCRYFINDCLLFLEPGGSVVVKARRY